MVVLYPDVGYPDLDHVENSEFFNDSHMTFAKTREGAKNAAVLV